MKSKLLKFLRSSDLNSILKMFTKRDKAILVAILLTRILLGFLDFAGIIIIGAIGSLAVSGISGGLMGNRVTDFLSFFGLQDRSLQTQVTILGLTASGFLTLKTLCTIFISRRSLHVLANKSAQFASKLVDKILAKNLDFIQGSSIQELIYAAIGGVNSLMMGVVGGWISLVADVSLLIILGTGLFVLDSTLALFVTLTFAIVGLVVHRVTTRKLKGMGERQAQIGIESAELLSQIFMAYREAIVRNRRGYYSQKISELQFRSASGVAQISWASSLGKYVFEIALVASSLLVAAFQFLTQPVGRAVAVLAVFLATSVRVVPAIVRIQQGVGNLKLQTGYGQKTLQMIKKFGTSEGTFSSASILIREHAGFNPSVTVRDLSFDFGNPEKWKMEIPVLDIRPGELTAIVGSSGAGKSTLVDLMLGIRTPKMGHVLVSNLPPQDSIQKWPGAIAYVPQESSIFNGTIRSNLALGYDPESIKEDFLWEALEIAHLDKFVRTLPGNLDAFVGERGTRLSGGQRQRLGIARAFVTMPRLLVLDEATSSLDSEVELAISESIQELRGRVTVVVIAHRLSTVVQADTLYYLKDGKVIGSGKFDELKESVSDFAKQASIMGL